MGETFREITKIDVLPDLIKAYCDEILAWYLYFFMSSTISGNLYPQLKDMLEETAKAEYEHAQELADMIVKLGGKPIADPMTLEDSANFPVIVPDEPLDLDEVCKVVAESEKNAITIYNALALKTKDSDIAVYQLIAHILSEEITHEENFENLRGAR